MSIIELISREVSFPVQTSSSIPRSPLASLALESQLIVILADYAFLYDIGRRDQGDQEAGVQIGSTRPGDFNIHAAVKDRD